MFKQGALKNKAKHSKIEEPEEIVEITGKEYRTLFDVLNKLNQNTEWLLYTLLVIAMLLSGIFVRLLF